ncbi:MAG: ABC transporter permease [Bacilli bacterium]|nr:ABC transporter permease [Bacilli bacterium]
MISKERKIYLKRMKKDKLFITISRILILVIFLFLWEILSRLKVIDTFMFSSPSKIINTIINTDNILLHVLTTLQEIIISFILGNIIGFIISSILWFNKKLSLILDPYLTIINSLPKVALGPLIIILFGANTNSIIIMALLISSIISILNMVSYFNSTDQNMIKIIKTMGGTKKDIFFRVVLPSNLNFIIDSFKVNISMCFVGVIMGEFLVSKQGIGYLINYGSQIFNMNLVLTGITLLILLTIILYLLMELISNKIKR